MKVIEGGFGKPVEGELDMTLVEVCAYVLNRMGLEDTQQSDSVNISFIIDTDEGFTVTSSKPDVNYVLAQLSKATHIMNDLALGGGVAYDE